MFRRRFSIKLVLLISLAYLIPVTTALVTLQFSSNATIERFTKALDKDSESNQRFLNEIFPHGYSKDIEKKEIFKMLRVYEERRIFGLVTSLIVVSLVLAALVIIISIIILKRAMLNLRDLSDAAISVGNGEVDIQIKPRSHDEFAKVSNAFNLMTKRLKETTVSRDFYNHVLESLPSAVFAVNHQKTVTTWNRFATSITEYRTDEITGKNVSELEFLKPILANPSGRHEINFVTKSGINKILFCDIESFPDRGSSSLIGSFIDMTQEKELEKQLISAKEKAEQSTKLRTEFLANMSHEIRTPLNGIIGMADILIEEEKNDEKKNMLSTIHQCGKRLLHIINEILELSKLEAGRERILKDLIPLNHIILSSSASIDALCRKKGLNFETHVSKDLPEKINVDIDKIVRILTNLLSNSAKFTEKGLIKLTVEKYNGPKKGNIIFIVEDSGKGIPPDRAAIIFESFVQINDYLTSNDGSGLGLAISKKLVELLGGEIWVENTNNVGSKFAFTITNEE